MIRQLLMLFAYAVSSLAANAAEPFAIKGYQLRQEMPTCPDGKPTNKPGIVMCHIPIDSYGGEAVKAAAIAVYEGRIIGAMINLANSGRYANGGVKAAIQEKYGDPDITSKPHINDWVWSNGDDKLALDGWKGQVILVDTVKNEEARTNKGRRDKNDL